MKTINLIVALLFTASAFAQDVPAAAKNAFKKKYPEASEVEWMETDNGFAAAFEIDDSYVTASFDASGKWIDTRQAVSEESLPEAVTGAIGTKHPEGYIDSAEKVDSPSGTAYEVTVNEGDVTHVLTITKEGKITGSRKIEMEDDDEE